MPKIRIIYREKDGKAVPDDVISIGAFAQIGAKRKFGMDALKSEDPEAGLYACFVELHGPKAAKDNDEKFDEWLMSVVSMSIVKDEDPEDPPQAETPSSDSSHESPPTSD